MMFPAAVLTLLALSLQGIHAEPSTTRGGLRSREERLLGGQMMMKKHYLHKGAKASKSSKAKPLSKFEASEEFRSTMTVDMLYSHLYALSAIGIVNDGSRGTGTDGYTDSVTYTSHILEEAGYDIRIQEFDVFVFSVEEVALSLASVGDLVYGEDFLEMTYSGSGAATGPASFVPEFGCEPADFADFPAGHVAVISRGVCAFFTKAVNAEAAGALGAIVYNDEARSDLYSGTLGADAAGVVNIPVLSAPFSFSSLVTAGEDITITVDATVDEYPSQNVLGEYVVNEGGPFIIIGGHLDTVDGTVGINDNGSGVAALYEMAKNFPKMDLQTNLRFAFWGAEELGLLGSEYYVFSISDEEFFNITMYLNFDMIASPNFMRSIYVPTIDEELPLYNAFTEYFDYKGLTYLPLGHPYEPGPDGRSDHAFFQAFGVPISGLFTGAEEPKTPELFELFGGTVDAPFDECYHTPCDNLENSNPQVLGEMAEAAAHVLHYFATMPDLNLTELAMEYIEVEGGKRRHMKYAELEERKRRLVRSAPSPGEYPFDRLEEKWYR